MITKKEYQGIVLTQVEPRLGKIGIQITVQSCEGTTHCRLSIFKQMNMRHPSEIHEHLLRQHLHGEIA